MVSILKNGVCRASSRAEGPVEECPLPSPSPETGEGFFCFGSLMELELRCTQHLSSI